MKPDDDQRTGAFADCCWQFVRGERPTMPTAAEFNLHPFLADNVARLIVAKERRRRRVREPKQMELTP